MGKIVELAESFANHHFPERDFDAELRKKFLAPFREIESEIEGARLNSRTIDWNVRRVTGCGIRLDKIESRLEALEKKSDTPPDPWAKKPIPTDKDGKPEGGLKPGRDIISYKGSWGEKVMGVYQSTEKTSSGTKIWAHWQSDVGEGFHNFETFMLKDQVTFEFRPKKPKEEKGGLTVPPAQFLEELKQVKGGLRKPK